MKAFIRTYSIYILFFLISIICKQQVFAQTGERLVLPDFNKKDDIIFFINKDVSADSAVHYVRLLDKENLKNYKVVHFCPSCDSTIFTIEGLNYTRFRNLRFRDVQELTKPPKKDDNSTGASSDDSLVLLSGRIGPLSYSVNYRVRNPDENVISGNWFNNIELTDALLPHTISSTLPPIKVGVLDTGLDTVTAKKYKIPQLQSCMNSGELGWNFIDDNKSVKDNYSPKGKKSLHGTPVTQLIIQEAGNGVNLQILPVKVLDKLGEGTLYQVMCGLAYAKSAGVKIINMSLGLYSSDRQALQGFQDYIKSVTDAGIIIVAAAGNADPELEQKITSNLHFRNMHFDMRNMDINPFFPAAFSDSNSNIISVTTVYQPERSVSSLQVSPHQNFSPTRVQIGVLADSSNFSFKLPGKKGSRIGSSFAAPVVTGQIAAAWQRLLAGNQTGLIDRDLLLRRMVEMQLISPSPYLSNKIYKGYLATHKQ